VPIRVLQIEDNPGDVALVRQALREGDREGSAFSLESAATLASGVERLQAGGFDIALLDLGLPDSKGLDTFSRARQQAPEIPIIVFSGLDDQALALRAVQQGAQDYMVKGSFDGALLTRAIRYAIGRWRTEQALHHAERRFREDLERQVAQRTAELEESHIQLRLADRLTAIGTLAAGLGHDMNNVLLPARCRMDALQALPLPPAAQEQLQAIRASTDYLQQLADGLRLLALDPDDADASTASAQVSSWWQQVGPLLRRAVPKSVELTVEIDPRLPPVAVPGHRLTQAILNLLVNSAEAVGGLVDRQPAIRVFASRSARPGVVLLGVGDNGRGMTEEVLRRALEPFFTTKKRGLGTGLGLALVRGVATSAGGDVRIESTPGRGTRITLELPTVTPARSRVQVQAATPAAITAADARSAAAVEHTLRQAGFQTVRTGDAPPPAGTRLWALAPRPELLAPARALAGEGARIVTLGPPPPDWTSVADAAIEDPSDLESIRAAIESLNPAAP
jgi:signal transduction histidine kinase